MQALAPNFQPSRVMADYEDGFTVALKEVYGQNLHIEGCWFHFSQAVVRKAKKIGLSGAFRDDEHAHKYRAPNKVLNLFATFTTC